MTFDTRLFVGNLPDNTTDADLRSAFSSYGQIVNLELKTKSGAENDAKKFSFITLSSSNYDVESCIRNFSTEDFKGNRLYVTRARESFLERLQRERQQEKEKSAAKNEVPKLPEKQPMMKLNENLNPHRWISEHKETEHANGFTPNRPKRKTFNEPEAHSAESSSQYKKTKKNDNRCNRSETAVVQTKEFVEGDKKKLDSDKKRLESMKKKREEFRQKQSIIKTGLVAVDKVPNKRVVFSDSDDEQSTVKKTNRKEKTHKQQKAMSLFDNDGAESDDEGDVMNFEIKEQFEGKKGQKVLELQSRYKSDKRFTLDERFVEDDGSEDESRDKQSQDQEERIDLGQTDEKHKQLNILQDVLGVSIRTRHQEHDADDNKKYKAKMGGMLRFDPSQPDHAKFLAPVEESKQEPGKKTKKKRKDKESDMPTEPPPVIEKVEVSKEQFYKVSETLKEAIEQPSAFSLRSLFSKDEEDTTSKNDIQEQETDYIPLGKSKEPKVKNPYNTTDKNPFKYDSSDSEAEEEDAATTEVREKTEAKAVWKERLFFSECDARLEEGLAFFNKPSSAVPKERRGLKSLMKKRLHNTERKDQMFKKKIGGRKKTMKKNYRKKS